MHSSEPSQPAPLRVLALDDSLTIRRLIGLVVKGPDYVLAVAEDGRTGLELLRRETPDVLLLDYMLPDMKGTDICEALASHLASRDVTVIVMSGKGEDVVSRFERFSVVKGYLHKPFKPAQLTELLDSLRAGRPLADQVVAGGEVPQAALPAGKPIANEVASTARSFSREQLGSAAQTTFRVLKGGLDKIPVWNAERAGRPAGTFFASRLLTPACISELLTGLRPLFQAPDLAPGRRQIVLEVDQEDLDRAFDSDQMPDFSTPLEPHAMQRLLAALEHASQTPPTFDPES